MDESKSFEDQNQFKIMVVYKGQQINTKEVTAVGSSVVWKHAIKLKVSNSKDFIEFQLLQGELLLGLIEIPLHQIMFRSKFQKWYPLKHNNQETMNQLKLVSLFEPNQAHLDHFSVLNFQMEKYIEKDKTLNELDNTLNVHSIMPEVSPLIP